MDIVKQKNNLEPNSFCRICFFLFFFLLSIVVKPNLPTLIVTNVVDAMFNTSPTILSFRLQIETTVWVSYNFSNQKCV